MTTADVRDMLDLPLDRQRPTKKQKTVERRPDGITRELFSLIGERAPPVAITTQVKYKERPKWSHKVQPWRMIPFKNPARDDDLVLQHWKRKQEPKTTSEESTGESKEPATDGEASRPESEYYYSKFNVQVAVPEYSEEQYEKHLQDDDWSKDETDYLMVLCQDYDLRWVLIADRYDFRRKSDAAEEIENDSSALVPDQKLRTMEDLKARYYTVSAKMMTLNHPLEDMLPEEYEQYEILSKFNPIQETQRKSMAEALLSRSTEDVKEEEVLLAELRRIINNQDRLLEERKELYSRLEAPQSTGNTQLYQSSQGLAQLMQTLLAADKNKKRRSLVGPGGDANSSPAVGEQATPQRDGKDGNAPLSGGGAAGAGPRDSIGGSTNKKGAAAAAPTRASERRKLTPREEEQFGVTHHERLTSGVSFRHERVSRLAQAKSNVQAQRVAGLLTELEIPPRLVMPTSAVCVEFERLIKKLHDLIDVRKVSEKVEGEVKVATAAEEDRERKARGEDPASGVAAPAAEGAAAEGAKTTEEDGETGAANDAEGSPDGEEQADVEMDEAPDAVEDHETQGTGNEDEDSQAVKEEEEGDPDVEVDQSDAESDADGDADGDAEADAEADTSTLTPELPPSPSRAGSSRATTRPPSSRGGTAAATASANKRSASVMSARSDRSSKRQRK